MMLEWKLFKIVVGSRNFWNLKIRSRESRGILKKHVFKRLLLPTRAPSQFVVNIYFVPFILGNLLDFYHLGSYFNCYIMFFWNLAKRSTVWRPYFPHMVNIPINFFFLFLPIIVGYSIFCLCDLTKEGFTTLTGVDNCETALMTT